MTPIELKPSELQTLIIRAYGAEKKRSILVWGMPGIGKTAIAYQALKQINEMTGRDDAQIWDNRFAQKDPVDVRGILDIVETENGDRFTDWILPHDLPTDPNAIGVLLIDEFAQCPPSMQNLALQMLNERILPGGRPIPDGVIVLACANRLTDKAFAQKLGTHVASRFAHIHLTYDFHDWITWANENGVSPEVTGFMRLRPDALCEFDPNSDDLAQNNPRTWEYLSDYCHARRDDEGRVADSDQVDLAYYQGTVGERRGREFTGFLELFGSIEDPDWVIENPDEAQVPEKANIVHAMNAALAFRATPDNFENILKFAVRLHPEYMVWLVRDAILRYPELQSTAAFTQWAVKNASAMSSIE